MEALEDLDSTTILLEPLRPVPEGKILRMKMPHFVNVISRFVKANGAELVTEGTSCMDYEGSIRLGHICEREQQTDDATEDCYISVDPSDCAHNSDTANNTAKPLVFASPFSRTAPFGPPPSCIISDSSERLRLDSEQHYQSTNASRTASRIMSHHLVRLKVFSILSYLLFCK